MRVSLPGNALTPCFFSATQECGAAKTTGRHDKQLSHHVSLNVTKALPLSRGRRPQVLAGQTATKHMASDQPTLYIREGMVPETNLKLLCLV